MTADSLVNRFRNMEASLDFYLMFRCGLSEIGDGLKKIAEVGFAWPGRASASFQIHQRSSATPILTRTNSRRACLANSLLPTHSQSYPLPLSDFLCRLSTVSLVPTRVLN